MECSREKQCNPEKKPAAQWKQEIDRETVMLCSTLNLEYIHGSISDQPQKMRAEYFHKESQTIETHWNNQKKITIQLAKDKWFKYFIPL